MALNKEMFSTYFEYKDFNKCIEMLRKEIIRIIVDRIKEKEPKYVYTTISALKNDCFKYLTQLEQEIVIELYDFSFNEESSDYELSCMMEMYKKLSSN